MIIDIARFVAAERPYWDELEKLLEELKNDPERKLPFEQVQRLHYLYERCSADLSRAGTFSGEARLRESLEALVAQAYAQIHETRAPIKIRWKSVLLAFPRAFRRQAGAFRLSAAATLVGAAFGWFVISQDPSAKAVLMPFPHLLVSPAERVKKEESAKTDRLTGKKATFSANLMTHNIRVTIFAMAAGISWGVGTLILLFYNGVLLGAVAADYVAGGQAAFLAGWLLPHGSIEIPAIVIGGQAGFVLASALIGWGGRETRTERFRAISHDLFALIGGAAAMLIWAGLIEAFVSQYHQPVIPYGLKIGFGICELIALAAFLKWAGAYVTERASRLVIETPEGVAFSYELATPVTRAFAWVVDASILGFGLYALNKVSSAFELFDRDIAAAVSTVAFFVFSIGYGIGCEWRWRGQTVGKRLFRLRVIDSHGLRLRLSQIVLRNLMRLFDSLPLLYLVGAAGCLFSRKLQRLGDVVANTVVVRERQWEDPDVEQIAPAKYNSLAAWPHLAARLRSVAAPEAVGMAVRAVRQRDTFDPIARIELFQELAEYFRSLVAFPPTALEGISDEEYVRSVLRVIYRSL